MPKCPRCFNELPPDDFTFTEAYPRDTQPDEVATAYLGHPEVSGRILSLPGQPGSLPTVEYATTELGAQAVELCPRCHFELPPQWRWGNATCVAMAGARYTGKTVYIAVMKKLLERRLEASGHELEYANEKTSEQYLEHYERPLYEERMVVMPTASARQAHSYQHEPLIFSMGRWGAGPQRYLVIRDVAGEDLEGAEVGGPAWEFFAAADAVFFLFDPMRVDEVRHHLTDLVPTDLATGGDPREVLRRVLRLICRGQAVPPKLAVIVSKFDALQALRHVPTSQWGQVMAHAGAAFSRDPGLLPHWRYDPADALLLHFEVRSLLERLGAGPGLLDPKNPITGQRYQPQRFFAVSALGESPEGDRLHANGISPFRCLDPVDWLMSGQTE